MNFDVRWKGIEHQQIWDWVHLGNGAKSSVAAERTLESMNKSLIASVDAVAKALGRTEPVWKGEAASKATAGMQSLRQYTDGLRLTSFNTRNSTMGQAGTSDWARKNVPPVPNAGPKPVRPTGNPVGDVLKQTQDWQKREAEARNAERRAQEIMEQHTSYTRQRVASMPALQPVPKIVLNTEIAPPPAPPAPPGPPPTPPRVRGGGSGGSGGGELGGGGQPAPTPRPDDRAEPGPRPTPIPTPIPGPNPIIPPDHNELVWNDRTPGGTGSGGGFTGEVGGGGYSGGGYSGGGLVGGGIGSVGGVPGPPSPHTSPGKGTAGGSSASAAPPRPAGTPGQQGFLQPASGAQREEDSEHQRKYWVPGSDLFEDDRLVAPPVIGED
ncbi:hypothetical protein [Allokutzneria albata]|uniref:PPE family protein n=1 Tax=Allokutzneria albata TaxID=211114 RepID=A0A1H0B6Q0_ALLAB|nr:hypothetical protein [Allokutzneria albata]SDN41340.1 hypothetical protein SAMN04489726_6508 [Allokutzneria albata]